MDSASSNEPFKPKSQLHPQRVVDLLAYHVGSNGISTNEKKELVLVIGRTRTGKSVLVNTLCGAKFYFDKDDGMLKLVLPDEVITPIGDETKSIFDGTTFPKVHFSEKIDGYIMDTPGYLGMDDLDLKVTKEQAIRLGVQQASRVKIVFLVSYKDLDGIQELSKVFVNILGDLCISDPTNIPVYFLFNQFEPPAGLARPYYTSPDDEKKNAFTVGLIRENLEKAVKVLEEQINRLHDRLTTRWEDLINSGLSEDEADQQIQNDADFHEMVKTSETCDLLKNSLESNYWGYFDPTNPYFVEETARMIRKARSVDPDIFDFSMYQNEWIIAKRWLEEELPKYKKCITALKPNKLYPKAFFDDGAIALNKSISEKWNDLNDWKNKENINTLTEKYGSDICSRIKSTQNEIDSMKAEVKRLDEEKARMEKNKVVLYEEQWNKTGSFTDLESYTVTYPLSKSQGYPVDVPITDRTIDISEPTCVFKDKYEPSKSVSVTEFRSVSCKKADAITKFLSASLLGSYSKYQQHHEEIKKQSCKGTVTFYGKESDKEWAVYAKKVSRINALNAEIAKKKQELKELNETNRKPIEDKIRKSISDSERQKDELSSLHKDIVDKMPVFPKEVQCACIEYGNPSSIKLPFTEKLRMIYNLCKVLAATTETTENVKAFIAMYEELQELEKQSSHITTTLENIPQLCTKMRIELYKCNEATPEIPLQQLQEQQQANQLTQKQRLKQLKQQKKQQKQRQQQQQ